MSESRGLQINWLAASGSALGAVTSAVLLSTLGAAGTLIGAALGSLIITVGGNFYSYSLERAKSGIEKTAEKVKTSAQAKKTASQQPYEPITASSDRNDGDVTSRVEAVDSTEDEQVDDESKPKEKGSWKQTLRGMSWKRVGLLAAGLFALTMAIILVFELSTGRPVSSYTGGTSSETTGTTFSSLTNRGGGNDTDEDSGTGTPDQEHSEGDQVEQDNNNYPQYNEEDQDVEQDQQQYESPEMQDDPAPAPEQEEAPQEEPVPQEPQQEEQPAPQQEEAPVAPVE